MYSLLVLLHSTLSAFPVILQLMVLSAFSLGWLGAHVGMEYAEILQRQADGASFLARLCGLPTVLLTLAILGDSLWAREYAKLQVLGGLVLLFVLIGGASRQVCRNAAHHHLVTNGYEQETLTHR
jgi:hypothetical protein